jgi:uncharacterized protein with FMN-binding domain
LAKAKNKKEKIDRIGGIIALLIIAVSAFIGFQRKAESRDNILKEFFPNIRITQDLSSDLFIFTEDNKDGANYLGTGKADGYAGELSVAVVIDSDKKISKVVCIEDRETPSFIERINRRKFTNGFNNISIEDSFESVEWPDAITGATYTTEAITLAVQKVTGELRESQFGLSDWMPVRERFRWEITYTILILVFVLAWLMIYKWFPLRKQMRWVLLIFNMVFLGFWFSKQLSISQISRLLSGDFPSLHSHLCFYLLLGGTLLMILLLNKNLYCDRICPFGAAQQCINAISGTKRHPTNGKRFMVWFQRILVLLVISASLILQNPTRFNYEVFSVFFKLIGTVFQFSLLIIVLLSSLFLVRPWCNILCPIKPVTDFVKMVRGWVVP